MGQYYRPVLKNKAGHILVLNRYVDGQFTMAKLTEHSWWENTFVSTVTKMLYHEPMRIAWVGDYADDVGTELAKKLHRIAWGDDVDGEGVEADEMLLDGKFILNHTKKLFLNCDMYKRDCTDEDGWTLHPLPLLTAIGNGHGGGDYIGINEQNVGCWAFDEIEISDIVPKDYQPIVCKWIDER